MVCRENCFSIRSQNTSTQKESVSYHQPIVSRNIHPDCDNLAFVNKDKWKKKSKDYIKKQSFHIRPFNAFCQEVLTLVAQFNGFSQEALTSMAQFNDFYQQPFSISTGKSNAFREEAFTMHRTIQCFLSRTFDLHGRIQWLLSGSYHYLDGKIQCFFSWSFHHAQGNPMHFVKKLWPSSHNWMIYVKNISLYPRENPMLFFPRANTLVNIN